MNRCLKNAAFFLLLFLLGSLHMAAQEKETIVEVDSVADETYQEQGQVFESIEGVVPVTTKLQTLPDSFTNRLRDDADFNYVKTGLGQQKPRGQEPQTGGLAWWSMAGYIAIALFVGLLIWYLASNNFILFKKRAATLLQQAETAMPQDIFSIDYAAAIRQALEQKDYRGAIRLQYLELLKKLSDRKLIYFLPDKTNFEYLVQMRSSNYYEDFFTATRHYEYSWYGLFDITENMYQKISNAFVQLKQKL